VFTVGDVVSDGSRRLSLVQFIQVGLPSESNTVTKKRSSGAGVGNGIVVPKWQGKAERY